MMWLISWAALLVLNLGNASADSSLNGVWVQPCAGKFRRIETIRGPSATLSEITFSDAACSAPVLRSDSSGTIDVRRPEIDFRFESVTITAERQDVVEFYNRIGMCGFFDWMLNIARDVTGGSCDFLNVGSPIAIPRRGEMRYGIYGIRRSGKGEQDRLYFGKLTPEKNAKTPAKRPTTLDPRYYIRRVGR